MYDRSSGGCALILLAATAATIVHLLATITALR